MHRWACLGITALSLCLAPLPVLAATPDETGKAVAVDPSATAELGAVTRTIIAGSDVSVGDTVVTGPAGQVQVLFQDQTKLVVGPNSSLLVETYLLRNDGKVRQFTINALSGSFRFVTGQSDKTAYEIKTATGMIGVRGTAFDFTVKPGIGTTLVLFHGAVRLCNLDQQCVDLDRTCGVASMAPAGSSVLGPRQRARANLAPQFPYVQSEVKLTDAFRIAGAPDCLPVLTAKSPKPVVRKAPPRPPRVHPAKPPRHQGPVVTTVEPGAFRTDFAGRSLVESATRIDDYADTAGKRRKENDTMHGNQAGDPAKGAAAIIAAVKSPEPPAFLLLGPDALALYRYSTQARATEIEKWETLSGSTDFDS